MKCVCHTSQKQLALLVGQDHPEQLPEQLRRRISQCPQCREHYNQLRDSQNVLMTTADTDDCALKSSLWPSLSSRVNPVPFRSSKLQQIKQHFIPVFSMTAACLAIAVVLLDQRPNSSSRIYRTVDMRSHQNSYLPSQPAMFSTEQQATLPRPLINHAEVFQDPALFAPETKLDWDETERELLELQRQMLEQWRQER